MKSFKKVMELDSTEAIKSAVEAGLGVGFVSRWAIVKELDLGVLKTAQIDRIRVTQVYSLSRTGPEPQGVADAFRTFTLVRARLISNVLKKTNPSR